VGAQGVRTGLRKNTAFAPAGSAPLWRAQAPDRPGETGAESALSLFCGLHAHEEGQSKSVSTQWYY